MVIEIDAIGLGCPQPVIKTREALSKSDGDCLLIKVNDPSSRDNVIRFLERSGVTIETVEQKEDTFYILTADTHSLVETDDPRPEELVCRTVLTDPPGGGKTVFFINKDRIGHGSDELGLNLMKAFVNTLNDLDVRPRFICFMNGGVKLTLTGSDTLPALQKLEESGVTMLVCGTCLNYFGVTEQCRVGTVSNMYDIATTMLTSSKVITP
ncbi:MAG: sulfurtransferase-like selenium metabolism protein YedF [Acidobacteria bacterium]|nr:sulfurtransferase-like selenium metabolism protein YedF [Acidobacteriota bacterium]